MVNLAMDETRGITPLSNPFSNEPFIIQIDRTDAVLKTQYITGTIFVITAVTGAASGICARAFVDVNDNQSVILELAEGFVDGYGRNMFFRNKRADVSLVKKIPKYPTAADVNNLSGYWKKQDGSKVKIAQFKHADAGGGLKYRGGLPAVINPRWAFWFNDDSFGAPAVRLSTAIFLDETLPFEQSAFDSTNRFLQVGWYGTVAMGARAIHLRAPGDGREIFTLTKVINFDAPTSPPPAPAVLSLTGTDQISAVANAAKAALGRRLNALNTTQWLNTQDDYLRRTASDGVFTGHARAQHLVGEVTTRQLSTASFRSLVRATEATGSPYPSPDRQCAPLLSDTDLLELESHAVRSNERLFSDYIGESNGTLSSKRRLGTVPKTTLEDLQRFKPPPQVLQGAKWKPKATLDEIFHKSELDGSDSEPVDTPYELFWRRMATRLKSAEEVADGVLSALLSRFTHN